MVETSFTAGVFFFIIFTGCELLRLGFNIIISQYVATTVLRAAILGEGITDDGQARGNVIEDAVINEEARFGVNLGATGAGDNPLVTVCSPAGCTPDNAGNEDDLITIQIKYPLPLFFGLGTYTVNVAVTGKNEPFTSF